MTDLNTLIPADSNLFIISASNVNERGQISGMASVVSGPHTGEIHAYLLTPADERIGTSMADFLHVHTRIPICTRMLATTFCKDSDPTDPSDKGNFRSFRVPVICRAKAQGRDYTEQHGSRRGYRRDPESQAMTRSWSSADMAMKPRFRARTVSHALWNDRGLLARFWNSEKSVKLFSIWCTRGDSNPRPAHCEHGENKLRQGATIT